MRALVLSLLMALSLLAGTAVAGDLTPAIPKASGSCVDDPAVMRRHHFDFLKHQRDDTLRSGIRGAKYSLKECVSCHAGKDSKGSLVPVNAEGQFCQSCHAYAAVSIDCFTCHATVPEKGPKTAGVTE
jgi:predicted CXXCH cytochrome family protein